MNRLRRYTIKYGMQATLYVLAFFARRKGFSKITSSLTKRLARRTISRKRIAPAENLQQLGHAWQQGFPSRKQVPITAIDSNTVYAEIHTPCPLRGTGDTLACYKMMNFDRKVVEHAGGHFVVLQSQAQKNTNHCKVAMRMKSETMDDLIPAHH